MATEAIEHNANVQESSGPQPCSFRDFLLYFLRLGTFGFGGPIALAGYMQRDLVESRRWISKEDYLEGLAFSQLSPGPLAAQLMATGRASRVHPCRHRICFALVRDGAGRGGLVRPLRAIAVDTRSLLRHRCCGNRDYRPQRYQASPNDGRK